MYQMVPPCISIDWYMSLKVLLLFIFLCTGDGFSTPAIDMGTFDPNGFSTPSFDPNSLNGFNSGGFDPNAFGKK